MSSIANLKILIVEDDLSLLKILSAILRRKGAQIFEATNGQEALQILATSAVDLVLSDVQMPVIDGLELLAEIRRRNPEIPVVLLVTGQAQIDEAQSIERGSAGLLRKPVRTATLIEKIESLLASGKLKAAS